MSRMVLESSDTEEEHSSVEASVPRTPFNTPVEGTHNSNTVLSAKQLEVYSWFLYWFSGFPPALDNEGRFSSWGKSQGIVKFQLNIREFWSGKFRSENNTKHSHSLLKSNSKLRKNSSPNIKEKSNIVILFYTSYTFIQVSFEI